MIPASAYEVRRLFVPPLGTVLRLTSPWRFMLHYENRNIQLLAALGLLAPAEDQQFVYAEDSNGNRILDEDIRPGSLYKTYRLRVERVVSTGKYFFDLRHLEDGKKHYVLQGCDCVRQQYLEPAQVTLPSGVVLVIDRIYIRNGARDFDSVTFRVKSKLADDARARVSAQKGMIRFWAKLNDVNNVECEVLAEVPSGNEPVGDRDGRVRKIIA